MKELSPMDVVFSGKLNEIIFANLENEHFKVKDLAQEIGMSRFTLNRKLHFICRKTINQYIREFRLERAMEMLLHESVTASEVGFKVGFGSPAYFSTCFSEYYGFPPGEARKRSLINPEVNQKESSLKPAVFEKDSPKSGTKPSERKRLSKLGFYFVLFLILCFVSFIYFFNATFPGSFNFITGNWFQDQKKSIAVLPFINDSKEAENEYFINGIMEAILDNLSKVKDLEVHPRTSVEPYRNNKTKSIPQIARELGVNYIIEGSGQKIGDQVNLYIQLIEVGSDKHLFSQRYNMKLEDIFNLQSEVAIKVASAIKAAITVEERELIEKTPTTNIEAMNLFLQASDVHNVAETEGMWELNIKAENLSKKAIGLDSTYADPYVLLGWIIFKRNIDSAIFLADKALGFDPKNPEAYTLKGDVYCYKGMEREAEEAYNLSIKYKPNNSSAFSRLGELYFYQGNCTGAIENQLKAFYFENNLMQERDNVRSFCSSLYSLGFYREGERYAARLLELNNDSTYYYWGLVTADLDLGNNNSALETALKIYELDTNNLDNIYMLFYTYLYSRDFKAANGLMQKYIEKMGQQGRAIEPDYLMGFIYQGNGQMEEANFHYDGTIEEMLKYLDLNQPSVTCKACITLAKIYSALNEKAKALEYLKRVNDCMGFAIFRIKDFKYCTMFDNIRQEPGFAEYLKTAEFRFRKEHEKVEKLLREEGVLISPL